MRKLIWLALACAAPSGARAEEAAPLNVDQGTRETMAVCSDGKHYVAIAPEDVGDGSRLFYGDGHKMFQLAREHRLVPRDWFFEPRQFNKQNNDNLRGLDLRVFSRVEFSEEKKTCSVTCGDRTTALKLLSADDARSVVTKADFFPSARRWQPYALARDSQAIYYYVDRGTLPQTEKSFRLFRGPKGAMKQLKMTDVASDSEGDIFATKTGSLRLIVDKRQSSWIEREKTTSLTMVPVEKNYAMIYNDLGVYAGVRLGTPCDDL
ncbi:MAG TPA: hypothetical protein VFF06_27975 [Polyangia bacterium]|nr:hypothetical protein [Polyangia bacterium]